LGAGTGSHNKKWTNQNTGEQQTMKILITGAFGNIGKAVMEEARKRAHEVIVFEIDNKKLVKLPINIGIKLEK
jgi:FlaA1/EpsC-like NDP-sugar epimerase